MVQNNFRHPRSRELGDLMEMDPTFLLGTGNYREGGSNRESRIFDSAEHAYFFIKDRARERNITLAMIDFNIVGEPSERLRTVQLLIKVQATHGIDKSVNLVNNWKMTMDQEGQEIRRLVMTGAFQMTQHALERSYERNISRAEVSHCAKHCIRHVWQKVQKTHLFIGHLNRHETGGFTAVLRNGAVVLTVFRRKLTKWEKKRAKRF